MFELFIYREERRGRKVGWNGTVLVLRALYACWGGGKGKLSPVRLYVMFII